MKIAKKQTDTGQDAFNWAYFNSARAGLKRILQNRELRGKKILLPAYIGYSTREGSGVFDPIRETKTSYIFYKMDASLNIDIEDIKLKIRDNKNSILLIIHYFGFLDKMLVEIKNYAKKYDMIIIEDFAHAFFTFWTNPVRDFDFGIFSIHKLFPLPAGGMVMSRKRIRSARGEHAGKYDLFNYDMGAIIRRRIENYNYLLKKLRQKAVSYNITILKKRLNGAVPQSFPILLSTTELRDRLYFEMNKKGYGVVSLYHMLIHEVGNSFTSEKIVSGKILNLPVHQDAEIKILDGMVDIMLRVVDEYNRNSMR